MTASHWLRYGYFKINLVITTESWANIWFSNGVLEEQAEVVTSTSHTGLNRSPLQPARLTSDCGILSRHSRTKMAFLVIYKNGEICSGALLMNKECTG